MKIKAGFLLLLLAAFACKKEEPNHFQKEEIKTVYLSQYNRDVDALIHFTQSPDAEVRMLACEAFGSVQGSEGLEALKNRLKEDTPEVKTAAAYAIGQIGDSSAVDFLAIVLEKEKSSEVKQAVLEAIGKCTPESKISALLAFEPANQQEALGKIIGLYRAGLRGTVTGETVEDAFSFFSMEHKEIKLLAAHYFLRFRNHELVKPFLSKLPSLAKKESDSEVKSVMVGALADISDQLNPKDIRLFLEAESHLIRINALRVLSPHQVEELSEFLLDVALKDKNPQVRHLAVQRLAHDHSLTQEQLLVATETAMGLLKAEMLNALATTPRNQRIALQLAKNIYSRKTSDYLKGLVLKVMAQNASEIETILNVLKDPKSSKVLTSNAIEALLSMDTLSAVKENKMLQKKLAEGIGLAIKSKDVGLVYFAATFLREEAGKKYVELLGGTEFLENQLDGFSLPLDIEAFQELKRTIASLKSEEYQPIEMQDDWYEPIDWEILASLPENAALEITTEKGVITLKLFPKKAPGTVSLLVKLATEGFYDGKTFHRVVPNFVAQGGCPRGDGFGGLEKSIRSEFARLYYRKGSCGIASAGKDTESCQFFITHVATPHLDGRYTIFGEVQSGWKVLENLEIGDKISHVKLASLK